MNLLLLAIGLLAFMHGVRDLMQYAGKRNFLTQFLHTFDSKKMEIPSAIISFSLAGLLFWTAF